MKATKQKSIKSRILIVDDHPLVQMGLTQLLADQESLEVIGQATNSADALTWIEREKPDVVIIDISLQGTDGIDLIKQIKARSFVPKMLVSSMHPEMLYGERAIRAGARAYVCKQEPPDRILEALYAVLKGDVFLSPELSEKILHRFIGRVDHSRVSPMETLSDRELEVFTLIGQGKTTRQIAAQLNLSAKTIDTYRDLIKKKLNLDNTPMLIREAVLWVSEQKQAQEAENPS